MKTIVAPTDFSTRSQHAVDYAADLAVFLQADLSIINVSPIPLGLDIAVPGFTLDQMLKDAEEKMEAMKASILQRTAGAIAVHVVAKLGTVITQVDDYCRSMSPYAVVMGSESLIGYERILSGDNTIAAINRITWPLIIVPPGGKFHGIKKIGLACDFKNLSDTIPIEKIKELVDAFRPEFHVVHVSMEGSNNPKIQTESLHLREMLSGINPIYHFIHSTSIEEGINNFALTHDLDLLIIVPKHHGIISRIFQHSHAHQMAVHTRVPILAIRG